MGLRWKLVLILLGVSVALAGGVHLIQKQALWPSFLALEHGAATRDAMRAREAIENEIRHLEVFCHDWSAWDDTYRFVEDRNVAYADANLQPETFELAEIEAIYFYNTRHETVWGRALDRQTGKAIAVPSLARPGPEEIALLLTHPDFEHCASGILDTPVGPMFVVSRPIIRSDQTGPSRGSVLFGRLITDAYAAKLAGQTRLDMRVWWLKDPQLPRDLVPVAAGLRGDPPIRVEAQSRDAVVVSTLFDNLQGRPSVLVHMTEPREIAARGRAAIRFAAVSTAVAGLLALVAALGLLQRAVVSPILRLTRHVVEVSRSGDLSARLPLHRNDEVGTLAKTFDEMLGKLAEARRRLLDQSFRSGRAEMAAGVLHNVRNALSPVVVRVDAARRNAGGPRLEAVRKAVAELGGPAGSAERREMLARFVGLGLDELAEASGNVQRDLTQVGDQLGVVQRILAEQDSQSHAKPVIEKLSLVEVSEQALDLMPRLARESVEPGLDPSLNEVGPVHAPRMLVAQVFANLLTNAAQARQGSNGRPAHVDLRAEREELDGKPFVQVAVTDDGAGMDSATLARVFEAGFSTKGQGSGLGLHWSANTAYAWGGKMAAESAGPGQGATFRVWLPVDADPTRGDSDGHAV